MNEQQRWEAFLLTLLVIFGAALIYWLIHVF